MIEYGKASANEGLGLGDRLKRKDRLEIHARTEAGGLGTANQESPNLVLPLCLDQACLQLVERRGVEHVLMSIRLVEPERTDAVGATIPPPGRFRNRGTHGCDLVARVMIGQ